MANGRVASSIKTFLALLGLLAVPVTYGLATGWNPIPGLVSRLSKVHSLSDPATTWAVRVGNEPTAAGEGGTATVVVFEGGSVDVRDARTGTQVWAADADWAALAGSGRTGGAVVLLGTRGKGYRAADAAGGRTRWSEPAALGVWAYTDLVVDITCPDLFSCTLRGRNPDSGDVRWRATLAANGRTFAGANRPLAALRPLGDGNAGTEAALPRPVPPLLGLRVDDRVYVYATRTGALLRSYPSTSTQWVTVAGDRVLVSATSYRGGSCRFTLSGQDPATGQEVWRRGGYEAATGTGIGCNQRRDPVGAGDLVAAQTPEGQDALLDAHSGGEVYRAPEGASILATDGQLIAVRGPDRTAVRLLRRSGATVWSRAASRHATVSLGPGAMLVVDPDAGRITAVDTGSGRLLVDANTAATALGYMDGGLVINSGRKVGLLAYGSLVSGQAG